MANLEEIHIENPRIGGYNALRLENEGNLTRRDSAKRKRSWNGRSSSGLEDFVYSPTSDQVPEKTPREDEKGRQSARQQVDGRKQDVLTAKEDDQAQFYKVYHKVAEEYDKEFLKKYDEDLNTTLIFAGLFSAVTSAFIVQVDSQLQPDPNDETAALLRVLIYQINSTAFGNEIPTPPQWAGPPNMIVQVQAMLFASLSASLFSAFLATLGKQWLNRYDSTDMRGSAVERSQNRQRKLDGTVAWSFDCVMESLPFMLQAALLLLGCALSRYLWEINVTIASVVIGVTSFGVIFYLFITVAGAASESCPFQTPGVSILRYIIRLLHNHLLSWFMGAPPRMRGPNQHTTMLGLQCISWMLQTSLDKIDQLPTIKHLLTMPELAYFDPILITHCFDIFLSGISVSARGVVIMQGLEELVTMAARCFLRTLIHLAAADPSSSALTDIRRRCDRELPLRIGSERLPFHYTMVAIDIVVHRHRRPHIPWGGIWKDRRPPTQEHIPLARYMAEAAQAGYQRTQHGKVPRWILRFALYSLSLDPKPPVPIVADCLKVIAIDLDCELPDTTNLDESTQLEQVSSLIVQKLETVIRVGDRNLISSKHKSISALFVYAAFAEPEQRMVNAISCAVTASKTSGLIWQHIRPYVAELFNKPRSTSLNKAITLVSPLIHWDNVLHGENEVVRWATTASATPYTEEVGQNVVDTLLQIAYVDSLRPHIPIEIWAWLKKRPSLPPKCRGRSQVTASDAVRNIRGLRDIEILKSYFLLVWSEWNYLGYSNVDEMEISIREDFSGTGLRHHRDELVERLDYVLGQLDRGLDYFKRHQSWVGRDDIQAAKRKYRRLKVVLLEADKEATTALTRNSA